MKTEAGKPHPLRIHQAIASRLGIAILSGEYQPGDSFVGEIEQSLHLGVSRAAYREAMRILISKGLVESRPKAGTHVTPRRRWNFLDPEILAWMFSGQPDERFISDLFELRGIVEPAAAALAADRHNAAHLAIMDRALHDMATHSLAEPEGQAADQEFHTAILAAAGNEALASLSSSVGAAVSWTTRFKQRNCQSPRDPLPEHIAVRDAIVARDAGEARIRMLELINLALLDMGVDANRNRPPGLQLD